MIRRAYAVLVLAALLLLYLMNATAAWVALVTTFVWVMTRRRRPCVDPPARPLTASEGG